MAEKVFVAMSGGVDSSVAAYLLLKRGFDVAGVTMDIWSGAKVDAVTEAGAVAKALGIKHYVFDYREEFRKRVVEPFTGEYLRARTPNPCVLCNEHIKWGVLFENALKLGADYFATGHYAKIVKVGNRYSLKSVKVKDQTYALYRLSQRCLSRGILPICDLSKEDVRRIAEEAGLDVSRKRDSQDICFIKDNNHHAFIEKYTGIPEEKGEFMLSDGTVIGVHNGISKYTIGQRKGLGISWREPLFVLKIQPELNRVILGGEDELQSCEFKALNVNFMSVSEIKRETGCFAKVRYAHAGAKCVIKPVYGYGDELECRFLEPQRALTPGQAAVFYDENGVIIAGGVISLG